MNNVSFRTWSKSLPCMLFVVAAASCSEDFLKKKTLSKTSSMSELAATADSAGNYTASMDPNSGSTQLLRATSGAVAGSAIAMPSGALSIPISVTIGEGSSLTTSSSTQRMGLSSDNPATAAGPLVSFIASSAVEASSPFTLSH